MPTPTLFLLSMATFDRFWYLLFAHQNPVFLYSVQSTVLRFCGPELYTPWWATSLVSNYIVVVRRRIHHRFNFFSPGQNAIDVFTVQYSCTHIPVYLLPIYSFSHISSVVLILFYTHHPMVSFVVPIVLTLLCGNLLSIDSRLNRIDPSTNIIFPPNAERGYITKFEILLEGVFKYSI